MLRRTLVGLALALAVLVPGTAAAADRSADIAALQVGLRARGFYAGDVDGVPGAGTARGVRALQRRARLRVDGVPGPHTRRALGWHGRHPYGTRALRHGARGWDVAALQFKLAWHGFPSGPMDGALGVRTIAALVHFQQRAGLRADGVAGAATFRALRAPAPVAGRLLRRPIAAPSGDRFGPRGNRFHAGLDFPAPTGTPVVAAAGGTVVFAGYAGGWGLNVVVDHGGCLSTRYAHLSSAAVATGVTVASGQLVGRVGMTGHATGPHLHFEVIACGADVDPATALP